MTEPVKEGLSQTLILMLSAAGIAINPALYVFSLVLAVSAAVVMAYHRPEVKKKSPWVMLLTAFVFINGAAIVGAWMLPDWPVPVVMLLGGLASGWLARIFSLVGERMELRATDIADRALDRVLPPTNDKAD